MGGGGWINYKSAIFHSYATNYQRVHKTCTFLKLPGAKCQVIPPRKREEEAGPSASSKAKKVEKEKEKEKVPLVPPPSPFQLPGTTRTQRMWNFWAVEMLRFGADSFWGWEGAPSKGWSLASTVLILYDSYVWTRLFLFPCIIVLSMDYHPFPTNKFLRSRQAGISDFDGAHLRDHLSVSLNASGCTKTTNTVPQNAKIPTFPNHNTMHLGPEMEKTPWTRPQFSSKTSFPNQLAASFWHKPSPFPTFWWVGSIFFRRFPQSSQFFFNGHVRNRFIGGTYHIFLAYFSGLNFREYPSKI